MEFNLTFEQLYELFKDGIRHGEDIQSNYDWGIMHNKQNHEAFNESLLEIVVDRTKYATWEEYMQAYNDMRNKLDNAW